MNVNSEQEGCAHSTDLVMKLPSQYFLFFSFLFFPGLVGKRNSRNQRPVVDPPEYDAGTLTDTVLRQIVS